jgi:Holliday junction DNA helicase RuvA
MIALLKGRIEAYEDDGVIVDVGGVGYHVTCSSRTLAALPRVGEMGKLFTEMLVSENAIRLVGFATEAERAWFRLLDNVQGVGTRVAIAVLSTLSTGELASAIAFGDKAMIGRSPGVGPKLAQRIVSELKDKAPALQIADPAVARIEGQTLAAPPRAAADAVSALVNLGYGQAQAGAAVSVALRAAGAEAGAERLIRLALRELAAS